MRVGRQRRKAEGRGLPWDEKGDDCYGGVYRIERGKEESGLRRRRRRPRRCGGSCVGVCWTRRRERGGGRPPRKWKERKMDGTTFCENDKKRHGDWRGTRGSPCQDAILVPTHKDESTSH